VAALCSIKLVEYHPHTETDLCAVFEQFYFFLSMCNFLYKVISLGYTTVSVEIYFQLDGFYPFV
jgi:hypothetical protein